MKVFSNTAMSADGKIGTHRHDHVAVGSKEDRRVMSELRARADAVLVGGKTFRNWPLPMVERSADLPWPHHRERPLLNAVLTRQGVLAAAPDRWPDPRVSLLVLGGAGLDATGHEERFGAEVETTESPDVGWALDRLAARGCRSVLVEGGGDLIFRCLDAGRLDEIFLTICPLIIGGTASPTPADGPGFDADRLRALRLLEARHHGGEVFLHYAVCR
ncbi:MAG: RibD family protein [Myxococcota bacterium]|nr:RibD family protein [Myxococcota bacterium]